MFSQVSIQPQAVAAVSHVATVINTVRQGSSSVIYPSTGRSSRVISRQPRPHVTEVSAVEQAQSEPQKDTDLDIDTCITILTKDENLHKLAPLIGNFTEEYKGNGPWRTSYVSAPTFFENKTGFKESLLSCPTSFTMFLNPGVQQLLSQTVPVFNQQQRGFITAKNNRKVGIGGPMRQTSETKLAFMNPFKSSSKNDLKQLLHNEDKDTQDKIKVAFAEGYSSKPLDDTKMKFFYSFFRLALGLALVWYLFKHLTTSATGEMSGIRNMFDNKFEMNPEETSVTFKDVRGCDEAKEELQDIVNFLKNPHRFEAVGAKLPKGVLLVGSPGIGKTLLAKAVAGEAGVPFFHASGSEFDEMFVGSGSRKVRQLFTSAKMRAPCLVFIDEIDSVGAKRTSSMIHPYANQTINQLLSEMDGFTPNEGVIVLGATNKRENLDTALLRPGRFDVEVNVMPPDMKGRKEIFELYLSKVKYDKSLNTETLAKLTYGMTGADIQNIVNQAALRAVLCNEDRVTMAHMEYARDKIIMGPAWKHKKIDKDTNWNTACHEAGHTIVAYYTKAAKPLNKVTILPRGQSLGHTSLMHDKESYSQTKAELLADLDVNMGGRAGEELIFGSENVTTGASSDFQNATAIATSMVKRFGMSDKIGQRVHTQGGNMYVQVNNTSPELQELIDKEIDRLLQESYQRAKDILKTHAKEHDRLSKALMTFESLDRKEIEDVIKGKFKPALPPPVENKM